MALFGKTRESRAPVRTIEAGGLSDGTLTLTLAQIDPLAVNVVKVDDSRSLAIVVMPDGAYSAFNLQCPHLGANLADGAFCTKDGTLRCPWHGYEFELGEGRFIRNPNVETLAKARVKGANFDPDKAIDYRLRLYPATANGGQLVVELN